MHLCARIVQPDELIGVVKGVLADNILADSEAGFLRTWFHDKHDKPQSATPFLVIGTLGSRDWAHTSFGRKIEAAIRCRPPLRIVSEKHWCSNLDLVAGAVRAFSFKAPVKWPAK
jgi:hypothetical protein